MKVFIVTSSWMGDGIQIEGVFSTKQKAQKYIDKLSISYECEIEEYEVQ